MVPLRIERRFQESESCVLTIYTMRPSILCRETKRIIQPRPSKHYYTPAAKYTADVPIGQVLVPQQPAGPGGANTHV